MHYGPFSEIRRLLLQPGCEAMRTFSPRSSGELEGDRSFILIDLEEHLGVIAGAVCGTLGLLLAVFAFLLWRWEVTGFFFREMSSHKSMKIIRGTKVLHNWVNQLKKHETFFYRYLWIRFQPAPFSKRLKYSWPINSCLLERLIRTILYVFLEIQYWKKQHK